MELIENINYGAESVDERLTRNKERFSEIRKRSHTKYHTETSELVKNTKVIEDGTVYLKDIDIKQETRLIASDPIQVALTLGIIFNHKTAILNFADIMDVGGLVFEGSIGTEAEYCRVTNLYESLSSGVAINGFYERSRKSTTSSIVLYSPTTAIIRSELADEWFDEPEFVDFISIADAESEELLISRLKSAAGVVLNEGIQLLVISITSKEQAMCVRSVLSQYKICPKIAFVCSDIDTYNEVEEILGDSYGK